MRYTKAAILKPRIVQKRSFKNFNANKFIEAIQHTSWWNVYESDDVEEAVKLVTEKIQMILDDLAPIKTFQVRSKFTP